MMAALTMASPLAHARDMFENGGASESDQSATSQTPKPPLTAATWEDADPAPAGNRVEHRIRRNLVIEGAGLLVFAYIISAAAAAGPSQNKALWVPVAGPFIEIPQVQANPGDFVQTNGALTTLLVIDGLLQVGGAAVMTYGLAVREGYLVKDDDSPKVAAMPIAFSHGAGFAIVGRF
jgi:hypothetical protein